MLLVERAIENPKVLACINLDHGIEENQAILENARRLVNSPQDLFVLSCWEFSGNDFLIDYMDEGMQERSKEEVSQLYQKLFDRLRMEYVVDDLDDQVVLLNENPVSAIPRFCAENQIDIAVMCSASLNHPLGRKLGSTIQRTIAQLPCGLMAVKPIGFQSELASKTDERLEAIG